MNTKPIVCGEALIDIERKRYDELIRKEEKLQLLTNAISAMDDYDNVGTLREHFGIKKKGNE